MAEGALVDMMDEEYTIPGELQAYTLQERRIEAWPERAQRRIEALEARALRLETTVARLERMLIPATNHLFEDKGHDRQLGTEAARIGRRPGGVVYCEPVFLQHSKPQRAADAIEQALAGRTVFVRREDAPAVVAALAKQESGERDLPVAGVVE